MIATELEYIKTGIGWMPELPEHWKIQRAKTIFVERSIKNNSSEPLLAASQSQGVVLKSMLEQRSMEAIQNFETFKLVEPKDFVISLRSFEGGIELAYFKGIISPVYNIFRSRIPDTIEVNFFKYIFKSNLFIQELNVYKTGIRDGQSISYKNFGNIFLPIPPFQEQKNIVNYLDAESAKITRFIQSKQRFIELLKEQRQSIITQAVTKGVDMGVKMMETGIEWMPEMPEHWKVRRIRYLGSFQNGLNKSQEFFGTGFPFVSYSDVYQNEILPACPTNLANVNVEERERHSVQYGDVLFTRTSETIEEIGFSSVCLSTIEKATFSGFLIRFRPRKDLLHPLYSQYFFRSQTNRAFFVKEVMLVTRASLSQDLLKDLPVLLPPIEEQIKIAAHIKTETRLLDIAISKAEREIELIKEYREAVIAEAVTGKLKL